MKYALLAAAALTLFGAPAQAQDGISKGPWWAYNASADECDPMPMMFQNGTLKDPGKLLDMLRSYGAQTNSKMVLDKATHQIKAMRIEANLPGDRDFIVILFPNQAICMATLDAMHKEHGEKRE